MTIIRVILASIALGVTLVLSSTLHVYARKTTPAHQSQISASSCGDYMVSGVAQQILLRRNDLPGAYRLSCGASSNGIPQVKLRSRRILAVNWVDDNLVADLAQKQYQKDVKHEAAMGARVVTITGIGSAAVRVYPPGRWPQLQAILFQRGQVVVSVSVKEIPHRGNRPLNLNPILRHLALVLDARAAQVGG